MIWKGLGVNYKALQANWDADIAYFNSIGLKYIRPNMAGCPVPWAQGTPATSGSFANVNAYWRLCAQYFASKGFQVTWGATSQAIHPISSSNWQSYHDAVVAEATYLQSQGIALMDFELGNEGELALDGVTMTKAQFNANLRQLATDVKAVYNLSPISYGLSIDTTAINDWIANGLGGLDSISLHPYGQVNLTGQYCVFPSSIQTLITNMINTFGSKVYISEFNIDAVNANFAGLGSEEAINAMRNIYSFIKNSGVAKALVYSFVGYLNGDNQFAMRNTDGSFNPLWALLLADNKRLGFTNA